MSQWGKSVRLREDTYERLKAAAEAQGESQSDLLHRCVTGYLDPSRAGAVELAAEGLIEAARRLVDTLEGT